MFTYVCNAGKHSCIQLVNIAIASLRFILDNVIQLGEDFGPTSSERAGPPPIPAAPVHVYGHPKGKLLWGH